MRYYIIAGEASGDLHASNLIKELNRLDPSSDVRGWGGDLMEREGVQLVKHYRELAFMGFTEVLLNIRTILRNIKLCTSDLLNFKPDVLILVDYPGFNLRIAEFAKKHNIRVVYYISPQLWAWHQRRVHKVKKLVDRMFVILPFEKEFYTKFDFEVEFVGHPLLDAIEQRNRDKRISNTHVTEKKTIALIPGSRKQEISVMLPVMLEAAKQFSDCKVVIAGAPSVSRTFYEKLAWDSKVEIIENSTYALLEMADVACVTSGTATLETALFNVPQVVCYKGNIISYQIARLLIKVGYISLVNLILNRVIVKELIQGEMTSANLTSEMQKLLYNQDYRSRMMADYKQLREKLGGPGASLNTAIGIIRFLGNSAINMTPTPR
jgi:lipid-A-disaccharide synthase